MSYGYVYVAQVAMGANQAQTLKAIKEAEAYNGPSLIIGYAPCEMHSIKGGMVNCQKEMKKAVDCGYWNMFRFNPALETKKFTLDSKAPAGGYREFLMNEARYSRLTREFPERAERLFTANEEEAKAFTHKEGLEALEVLSHYCDVAIVKVGKDGSYIQMNGETTKVDPVDAIRIDTTGAGDIYAAGFLYGYLNGMSAEETGRLASWLSARMIENVGAKLPDEVWAKVSEML